MGSVYVVKRETKTKGNRFHVRYQSRKGAPGIQLGIFPTETLAKKRVRSALEQLARGETPSTEFARDARRENVASVTERYLANRLDAAESTILRLRYDIRAINDQFGKDDPSSITPSDIREWILVQSQHPYGTGTIRNRLSTLRSILGFAGVRPNPARDEEIRLPRSGPKRNRLPSTKELDAFYAVLPAKYQGVIHLIEQSGIRISEAVAVRHEHWDRRKRRLLVPDSKTSAGERFIEQINGLPEMPPKGVGLVFENVTVDGAQAAIAKACKRAKIRTFSAHDLRKLAISRCLRDGMDPILVSVRAGHSSPQITLGTYAKLVPPE